MWNTFYHVDLVLIAIAISFHLVRLFIHGHS
jgi:hypothetical protein